MSHSKRILSSPASPTTDGTGRSSARNARTVFSPRLLASPRWQAWLRAQRKSQTLSRRTHTTA